MSLATSVWENKSSGMDKQFFHNGQDEYGWLNFKDKAVMTRELQSRGALVGSKDILPEIDTTRAPPALQGGTEPSGYYIKRIDLDKTIKPKMCALMVPNPVKRTIQDALNTAEKKANGIASLTQIQSNLASICSEVGELTIAFDKSNGKAYLLDLAKDNLGKAGGADLQQTAGKGIANILKLLG
jgi:hypothetical protein